MAKVDEKKGTRLISDMLAEFMQRNRKILLGTAIAVVVVFAGFIAVISIRNMVQDRAISQMEALNDRYEALRFDINESAKAEDVRLLLEDLTGFAQKNTAYAGSRAYSLIGAIYGDQKNWPDAEQAWLQAAKKAPNGYLKPVALYNAAIAAEEGGELDTAIEHFRNSLLYQDNFPAAIRAQFAIGRLLETQNKQEEAIEAYRAVIQKWPYDTVWTNLANSRIIILSGLNS